MKKLTNFSSFIGICGIFGILLLGSMISARADPPEYPSAYVTWTNNSECDAVCGGGDGLSWETAYIFENYTFSSTVSTPCMLISGSDRFVIVRNCMFYQGLTAHEAVKVNTVKNIRFENCTVTSQAGGFWFSTCQNVTVQNCTVYDTRSNGFAILFQYGGNNTISDVTIVNSFGMKIYQEGNDLIENCRLSYIRDIGFYLETTNHITISSNIFSTCKTTGITLAYGCHNTNILSNNFLNINEQGAIRMSVSDNVTVAYNNISRTCGQGIFSETCNNLTIVHNEIAWCQSNAIDYTGSNLGNVSCNNIHDNIILMRVTGHNNLISYNTFKNNYFNFIYDFGMNNQMVGNTYINTVVVNGTDGEDGEDGLPGLPGEDGEDGVPGLPGEDGADGEQGLPGPEGPQGPPGEDGLDGQDAQGINVTVSIASSVAISGGIMVVVMVLAGKKH